MAIQTHRWVLVPGCSRPSRVARELMEVKILTSQERSGRLLALTTKRQRRGRVASRGDSPCDGRRRDSRSMSRDVGRFECDREATASWALPHLEPAMLPGAATDAPARPSRQGPRRGGGGHVRAVALVSSGRYGTAANGMSRAGTQKQRASAPPYPGRPGSTGRELGSPRGS